MSHRLHHHSRDPARPLFCLPEERRFPLPPLGPGAGWTARLMPIHPLTLTRWSLQVKTFRSLTITWISEAALSSFSLRSSTPCRPMRGPTLMLCLLPMRRRHLRSSPRGRGLGWIISTGRAPQAAVEGRLACLTHGASALRHQASKSLRRRLLPDLQALPPDSLLPFRDHRASTIGHRPLSTPQGPRLSAFSHLTWDLSDSASACRFYSPSSPAPRQ